jgi:hypothetical protein
MLAGAFLTRGAFARAFTGIGAHPSKSRFNCFGVAAFATGFMSGLLTAFFRAMSDTYRVTIISRTGLPPAHVRPNPLPYRRCPRRVRNSLVA